MGVLCLFHLSTEGVTSCNARMGVNEPEERGRVVGGQGGCSCQPTLEEKA